MPQALLKVTPELLRDLLHLPEDAEVVPDETDGTLLIGVDHASIEKGASVVTALFKKIDDKIVFQRFVTIEGRLNDQD